MRLGVVTLVFQCRIIGSRTTTGAIAAAIVPAAGCSTAAGPHAKVLSADCTTRNCRPAQIAPFWHSLGGHTDNQVGDHIGGSRSWRGRGP
jgi:hypothetical protein